jgi:hypothetical protein
MGFFKNKEEVVAGADNHHPFFTGNADIFHSRQRRNAVYLYFILI